MLWIINNIADIETATNRKKVFCQICQCFKVSLRWSASINRCSPLREHLSNIHHSTERNGHKLPLLILILPCYFSSYSIAFLLLLSVLSFSVSLCICLCLFTRVALSSMDPPLAPGVVSSLILVSKRGLNCVCQWMCQANVIVIHVSHRGDRLHLLHPDVQSHSVQCQSYGSVLLRDGHLISQESSSSFWDLYVMLHLLDCRIRVLLIHRTTNLLCDNWRHFSVSCFSAAKSITSVWLRGGS